MRVAVNLNRYSEKLYVKNVAVYPISAEMQKMSDDVWIKVNGDVAFFVRMNLYSKFVLTK